LAEQFGVCFDGAHAVFVTDIYPAGEDPIPGVSADLLLEAIKARGNIEVFHANTFETMIDEVLRRVEDGDMVITLGAGDIFKAGELLLTRLKKEK
jgi:UDP-N-acetylmuramate--alanine ligase